MKTKPTLLETLKKTLASFVLKLPLPVMKILNGKPIQIDGQTMDTVVQFMVQYFTQKKDILTPKVVRREFDIQGSWFAHPPEPSVSIEQWFAQISHGQVPCEIHRSNKVDSFAPALLFFHGGGHVAGSLESHRNVCRQLAHETHCVVIAVGYRLAPEHKFPAGIQDCLATYDAVAEQASALGINPKRIGVGGDSAGGNAAAVVAQQRKSFRFAPKFQVLWVPWVDMSKQSRSYELMGKGFFLDKKTMEWYTAHYLNTTKDAHNPLASPLLGDVQGVCPAAIYVAGFDPLRDEGIAYAKKLQAANVPISLTVYEGAVHPFINVAGKIPLARKAFAEAVLAIKKNL